MVRNGMLLWGALVGRVLSVINIDYNLIRTLSQGVYCPFTISYIYPMDRQVIKGPDFNKIDKLDQLFEYYASLGIQSTNVHRAVQEVN